MGGGKDSWELELWSYLSRGDGVRCSLHVDCAVEQACGWCIDERREKLSKLYDSRTIESSPDELDIFRSKVEPYFPECWLPGPVFQLVGRLANKHLQEASIIQPPIPTQIIEQFDVGSPIEIRFVPLKSYHGAIWHLEDGWVIHVNTKEPAARQRLTIFHEVFHIPAHCNSTPVFRKQGMKEGFFNEMLADYFSGCLLMPKSWVEEKWVEVKDLRQMAQIFQVTEVGMWIRLKTMGLIT